MGVSVSLSNQHNSDPNLKVWISSDEAFTRQLRAHDKQAFKLLYQKYAACLYGSILTDIKEPYKAELILEKVFLTAWETISTFDETKIRLFTWLKQIMRQMVKSDMV